MNRQSDPTRPNPLPLGAPSRRDVLRSAMLGIGGVALADLLSKQSSLAVTGAPSGGHFTPRVDRVIYIFLEGGLSQVDSYDYKPRLQTDHGKPLPESIRPPKFTFAPQGKIIKSPFGWKQWGDNGTWASDLFPRVNEKFIDDLCFMHALHHTQNDHITAKTFIHTGVANEIRPTLGSWLVYGLGSFNANLPGYIDIVPDAPKSRPTGFLPARYRGTAVGRPDKKSRDFQWENLKAAQDRKSQRKHIDFVQQMNREHLKRTGGGDDVQSASESALEAEIQNMELAFRMQAEAPDLMDLSKETLATQALYGVGEPHTDQFGRALLLARRFSEAGVRYVTVTHATQRYGNLWDQHSNLESGHRGNARAVDTPIAGLLADLRSRGLLDNTLVMCGSEFGRTPTFEFMDGGMGRLRNGRDHNPHGFTMWFAGGGVRAGYHHGATDEYGYYAVRDKVSIHDLHATILHAMGLDHEKLTYEHGGRHFRLTDVYGDVVRQVLG